MLADALVALHRPRPAIEEALEQAVSHSRAPEGARQLDFGRLAQLDGDFARAERLANEYAARQKGDLRAGKHTGISRLLVHLDVEMGRTADAVRVARDFVGVADSFIAPAGAMDIAIASDPLPEFLHTLSEAGAMPSAEYEQRIATWIDGWRARALPSVAGYIWIAAYAATSNRRDDAERALAALPRFGGIPAGIDPLHALYVGHVYALAGRWSEAVELLERGTRSCSALESPLIDTRAYDDLGLAREGMGDVAAACDAYAVVLERWGKAKPRSVTAEHAAARRRAICGR